MAFLLLHNYTDFIVIHSKNTNFKTSLQSFESLHSDGSSCMWVEPRSSTLPSFKRAVKRPVIHIGYTHYYSHYRIQRISIQFLRFFFCAKNPIERPLDGRCIVHDTLYSFCINFDTVHF